jgi:phosphotransferase system HPr (HPr) family protein
MPASFESITLSGDLHARPAGAVAVAAGRFIATVRVSAGGRTADAKSVLSVMGLGATVGQQVTVSAEGPDAHEAVAALIAILGEATRVGGLAQTSRGGRARPACHTVNARITRLIPSRPGGRPITGWAAAF